MFLHVARYHLHRALRAEKDARGAHVLAVLHYLRLMGA